MNEINRQIVLFGDFKSIGFDIQKSIPNLTAKNSLFPSAAPDYIPQNSPNPPIDIKPFQPLSTPTPLRPVLTTANNHFSVFFGTTRLHIEESQCNTEDYDTFIAKAKDILNDIFQAYGDMSINRLAVNGKIVIDDEGIMNKWYTNTFKSSDVYGDMSDEFSFYINTKFHDQDLNTEINKIIACKRANEILPNNEMKPIMIVDYDYNTAINISAKFELSQLDTLINQAKEFKNKIINRG